MKTETLEPTAHTGESETYPRHGTCGVQLDNILVPLDLSEESLGSLQFAVTLAEQFGAKLTLLHVIAPPLCVPDFPYPGPAGQDGFESVKGLLQEIRCKRIPTNVRVETIVRGGFAVDVILSVAEQIHADIIVVTTHGDTGIKHLLKGSLAETIVRRAPCPVLAARAWNDV